MNEELQAFASPERIEALKGCYREVLTLLGEDTEREGLLKTPERVRKSLEFLTRGYRQNVDQLVGETDMEVRELMSLLVSLELKGYIREISKNYYISVQ